MKTRIITALCTPLQADQTLDPGGLEVHIAEQFQHGIHGLLVAGTMGLMQLQTDQTYTDLVAASVRIVRGRCELMVGVGDASFARTRDRILAVAKYPLDGVVVLSPYLIKFSQAELIDYYRALADVSPKPIYLYDLPVLTGTKLEHDTVLELARHPNIRGIKCSGAWEDTRQLIDRLNDLLRVIPAQPHLADQLVRMGVGDNLDGIFGIAPAWIAKTIAAAEAGQWAEAAVWQRKISELLHLLRARYTVFGGCEAVLNARGISGQLAPAPLQRLTAASRAAFLQEALIQELIRDAA